MEQVGRERRLGSRSTPAAPTRSRSAPTAFTPDGELHYVNVSGMASSGPEGLLDVAREAINEGFISAASSPVGGLFGAEDAEAAPAAA